MNWEENSNRTTLLKLVVVPTLFALGGYWFWTWNNIRIYVCIIHRYIAFLNDWYIFGDKIQGSYETYSQNVILVNISNLAVCRRITCIYRGNSSESKIAFHTHRSFCVWVRENKFASIPRTDCQGFTNFSTIDIKAI